MTPLNRTSTDYTASPAPSIGLGGPLWILALVLAVSPPFCTAELVASVWRYPPILDSGDYLDYIHNFSLVWRLALAIALWWAAVLFFRRATGFPRSWWILVLIFWLQPIVLPILYSQYLPDEPWRLLMMFDMMRIEERLLFLVPIALALYLVLSPHARRTFGGSTATAWGHPALPDMLRHGPDDWSRSFWLIPGLLLHVVLLHIAGAADLAADAFKSIPVPERGAITNMPVLGIETREHLQATRLQWGIHLLALSFWPFACHAFVRRRPRTVWLVIAMLAATVAAPLPWIVIDPPPIYLDGPDHEAQLLSAIVLCLIVLPALWLAWKHGRFARALRGSPQSPS